MQFSSSYLLKSCVFLLLVTLVSCKETSAEKENQIAINTFKKTEDSQWVSIFNGKDLEGWIMKIRGFQLGENFANTFRIADGILSIRYDGYGDNFDDRFGGLYFNKRLSNYRIRAEYRFVGETAPGAPEWGYRDSGIQFHSQPPATLNITDAFPICLEYNLHGGNGTDDRPVGAICANGMFVEIDGEKNSGYCTPARVSKTFHGDQWVTLEIDIRDGQITHFVNGEEILRYSNPTYDPENQTAKAFIINGDNTVKGGYLSIQSNSHPIDFRKIELMEY